jgi:hypothetical protein
MADKRLPVLAGLQLTRRQITRFALRIGVPSGLGGLELSLLAPMGHPWAAMMVLYTAAIAVTGTALLLWQLSCLARAQNKLADIAALAADIPHADFASVWPELVGWVQAAAEDGESIDPDDLLPYLAELERRARQPVRDWMRGLPGQRADGTERAPQP